MAAALLVLAGAAKLRSPGPAGGALTALGFPIRRPVALAGLVRSFATGEIALGLMCLIRPSPPGAVALGALYGAFSAMTIVLVHRRASCGCFGDEGAPASPLGALLSGALALTGLAAATQGVHGLGWLLSVSPLRAAVLGAGLIGGAYAATLMFRALPALWGAWSVR